MKLIYTILLLIGVTVLQPCAAGETKRNQQQKISQQAIINPSVAGVFAIQKLNQVPVLCYHNIHDVTIGAGSDYTVSTNAFKAQVKILADSGYHTILPAQLWTYLIDGTPLPPKPIMFTFDDTHREHYSIAAPEQEKYGFKGVFFIMTVCVGKPGYMTAGQLKALSKKGHIIGGHTWDHFDLRTLHDEDWVVQLDKPNLYLEKITGKPVQTFAYPFGAWNDAAIDELKKRGIKEAFQLSGKQSEKEPLYTIRRILVAGNWSTKQLLTAIKTSFK